MFAQFLAVLRVRPFVSICVALALLLGAVNYFLAKTRREVAKQHEEIRQKGAFMLRALANRTRIESDLAALRTGITQIEKNLLDEGSMEVNLGYFYKLEKSTRVRLARLNQLVSAQPSGGSPFKSVPFSMQITGSYRNSMSFLRALETGPHIIRVRNCSFERSSADNSEFIVDLTVDVLSKV